ncbi:hypothetical protein AK812_SmicGene19094 [Symbiodinium microadriaticum]|uniref:Uncharacterized protein n=1 Tax=Symbiodinium microadriaticum TaxID=2951 RepID=A0A1Q9DTG7_SYMMI|nr:hypothetical protein AK812_SmicGene19094 [Symbiodinium microadriaticum]
MGEGGKRRGGNCPPRLENDLDYNAKDRTSDPVLYSVPCLVILLIFVATVINMEDPVLYSVPCLVILLVFVATVINMEVCEPETGVEKVKRKWLQPTGPEVYDSCGQRPSLEASEEVLWVNLIEMEALHPLPTELSDTLVIQAYEESQYPKWPNQAQLSGFWKTIAAHNTEMKNELKADYTALLRTLVKAQVLALSPDGVLGQPLLPVTTTQAQHWCYQYQLCWWPWQTGGEPVELVDTSVAASRSPARLKGPALMRGACGESCSVSTMDL